MTYFILLKHAYQLQARENLQLTQIIMAPRLNKEAYRKFTGGFYKVIDDGGGNSDAIIKADRERLRALMKGKLRSGKR